MVLILSGHGLRLPLSSFSIASSRVDGSDGQRVGSCRLAQSFVEVIFDRLDLGVLHAQESDLKRRQRAKQSWTALQGRGRLDHLPCRHHHRHPRTTLVLTRTPRCLSSLSLPRHPPSSIPLASDPTGRPQAACCSPDETSTRAKRPDFQPPQAVPSLTCPRRRNYCGCN